MILSKIQFQGLPTAPYVTSVKLVDFDERIFNTALEELKMAFVTHAEILKLHLFTLLEVAVHW